MKLLTRFIEGGALFLKTAHKPLTGPSPGNREGGERERASAAHVVGLVNSGRASEQKAVGISLPGPEAGHPQEGHSLSHLFPRLRDPWLSPHSSHRAITILEQGHQQGDWRSVTKTGYLSKDRWADGVESVEPAAGHAGLAAAQGPPHTKWDLLSYPNTSQVLRLFNQNGVPVGSGFELSEGFRRPLTSRAIKVL